MAIVKIQGFEDMPLSFSLALVEIADKHVYAIEMSRFGRDYHVVAK
jgi:hypothetical protein